MSNQSKVIWLMASVSPLNSMGAIPSMPQDQVELVSFKSADDWLVVNDDVMGGVSQSSMRISEKGLGIFSGQLSLENNGGFASVRTMAIARDLKEFYGIRIRVKGDGRQYQLRLRTDNSLDGVAYRSFFETQDGVWKTIEIGFDEFLPSRRGRVLTGMNAVDPVEIRQIGFLVAGDQPGPFLLEVAFVQAIAQKGSEQ